MKPFIGQLAVVTGASSGIGKAIALALGRLGTTTVLAGRRREPLEQVAATVTDIDARARVVLADLTDLSAVAQLAVEVADEFAGLDFLVHAAGIIRRGAIADAPVLDFELQFRTNVLAPYVLTQALLPQLRRKSGQVVFINSSAGLAAGAQVSQYAATKHALKAIADSLRAEVNADGIRVISVYPGQTATSMQERLRAEDSRPFNPSDLLQPGDIAASVVHALQLPRTAEVTDLHIRPMMKPT